MKESSKGLETPLFLVRFQNDVGASVVKLPGSLSIYAMRHGLDTYMADAGSMQRKVRKLLDAGGWVTDMDGSELPWEAAVERLGEGAPS